MHRLLSLALVALLAAGCAGRPNEPEGHGGPLRLPAVPNADEGTPVAPHAVRVGACLNDTDPLDDALRRRVLDCTSPHRFEVFAVATLPLSAPAPTERQRADQSRAVCEARLAALLGDNPNPRRSELVIAAFDDYVDGHAGDRTVACAIAHQDLRQYHGNVLPSAANTSLAPSAPDNGSPH